MSVASCAIWQLIPTRVVLEHWNVMSWNLKKNYIKNACEISQITFIQTNYKRRKIYRKYCSYIIKMSGLAVFEQCVPFKTCCIFAPLDDKVLYHHTTMLADVIFFPPPSRECEPPFPACGKVFRSRYAPRGTVIELNLNSFNICSLVLEGESCCRAACLSRGLSVGVLAASFSDDTSSPTRESIAHPQSTPRESGPRGKPKWRRSEGDGVSMSAAGARWSPWAWPSRSLASTLLGTQH